MINNLTLNNPKQFEKKLWLERKLYQFKDQKDFQQTFKKHIQKLFQTNVKQVMHNLREKLFRQFNSFVMSKQIKFQTKCSITKKRPENQFQCIRLLNCKSYHLFDLKTIYRNYICKLNPNSLNFACQLCSATVTKTEDIEIDILSYQFFHSTEDVAAKLIINTENIESSTQTIRRAAAIQTEYQQTVIKKENQLLLLTLNFMIKSAAFDKLCGNNDEISTIFQNLLKREKKYIHQYIRENNPKDLLEVSLICPLSFRRIFNPLMHNDCKHDKIILFDLEYALIELYKQDNPAEKLKCPQCQSFFTISNLNEKAIIDISLRKDLYKQPTYYTLSTFNYQNYNIGGQESRIKTKLSKQMQTKVYDQQIPRIRSTVGRFWKALKYDEKVYMKNLKKISDAMTTQIQKLIIVRSQIKYPVRCKACKSLNVADLWSFVARLQSGLQKQKNLCLANNCKLKNDDTNTESNIYFDFQLFKLLEHNITNLIYNKNTQKYIANLQQLTTKNLEDYLKFIGHQIKNDQFYYKKNFNMKFKKMHRKQKKHTLLFILQNCLKQKQPQQHIIYLAQKQNYTEKDFYCEKCKISAKDINEIYAEHILKTKFEYDDDQLITWNANTKDFELSQTRIKISQYYNQRQQLIDIVKSNNKMQYIPARQTPIKILNKNNQIIQFPIYIQSCKHQKEDILKCVLDLKAEMDIQILKCPICKYKAEYVDQLRYLYKLHEAIQMLKQNYANSVIIQSHDKILFKRIENSGQGELILDEDKKNSNTMLQSLMILVNKEEKKTARINTTIGKPLPRIKQKNPQYQKKVQELKLKYPEQFDQLVQDTKINLRIEDGWNISNIRTKGGIIIFNKQRLEPLVYNI